MEARRRWAASASNSNNKIEYRGVCPLARINRGMSYD